MFNADFYPTPTKVIATMLDGIDINGKIFLEPSAGRGDIVDYLWEHGAHDVIACEKDEHLMQILYNKCNVIEVDFLKLTSDKVSHIDFIIMNPPFSKGAEHILHAWNIAPNGCKIVALCNSETIRNTYSSQRQELYSAIENYGEIFELGNCFATADRQTDVKVTKVVLSKSSNNYETEFDGFFMEEEEESLDQQGGIMPYNIIRDLVNRYVASIKIFDKQIEYGIQMNQLTKGFFKSDLAFEVTELGAPKSRNDFKKEMQKSAWKFIFQKLNMQKYATQGLREDINKFIEEKTHVPFTMRNIYVMLQTIVDTQGQQMDKAIEAVFDKLTMHYDENRFKVEGWKTNSHYLMGEKWIMPNLCAVDKWHTGNTINTNYGGNFELIEDMVKAITYIIGQSYDNYLPLRDFLRNEYHLICNGKYVNSTNDWNYHTREKQKLYEAGKNPVEQRDLVVYGSWFDWGFFRIKCFKKGTIHFEFKDKEIWAKFNQRVAKIKGYPLFEGVNKTEPKAKAAATNQTRVKPTILATFSI